jgi:superfamily II DNA or RNA helicase
MYVPYEAFRGQQEIEREKRQLTWKPRDKGDTPIFMYKDLPDQGYLGVPRSYGMLRWPWLRVDDQRTLGAAMLDPVGLMPDPNHPAVKEPLKQAKFMADMEAATQAHEHFIAYATTGSGKTVVGARNARLFGRKTAILVPLERLLDQWRRELIDKLGVSEDRIGIVQSDTCQWKTRDWVLCMMKSLGQRRYPNEFYESIGMVIADECHRLGTPELAMTTALFPARYRVGLSATPERSDGSDRAIFWHIGPIKVRSEATAVECDIYTLNYDDGGRMAAIPPLQPDKKTGKRKSDHGFRIKKLTQDWQRNRTLATMVYRLWKAGRKVLAIGEHVAHVQEVMEMAIQMGVPREACGQCTAERHVFREVQKGNRIVKQLQRKVKITREEFDRAKTQSDVVFACVDDQTECLTLAGWKTYDTLEPGELIASYNVERDIVEYQPLQHVAAYDYNQDACLIDSPSMGNVMMTWNHRNVVDHRYTGERKVVEARDLNSQYRFILHAPVVYPERESIGLRLAELMGWIIAEGSYAGNNITLSQSGVVNPHKVARVDFLLQELRLFHSRWVESDGTVRWRIVNGSADVLLRLSPTKELNADLLALPQGEAEALFWGLLQGDGHTRNSGDGRLAFTQVDGPTADWFQVLAMRCGFRATKGEREDGKVNISLSKKDRLLTWSNRFIVRNKHYTGTMWCPVVENSTWVARRNGAVFITGNTYGCFKEGIDEPRLDALITLTPQAKDKQVRGRVRRPFPGKEKALYISMVDVGDYMSMRYYQSRLREWSADPECRVIHGKL